MKLTSIGSRLTRYIAILLTVVMLFGMAPPVASAAQDPGVNQEEPYTDDSLGDTGEPEGPDAPGGNDDTGDPGDPGDSGNPGDSGDTDDPGELNDPVDPGDPDSADDIISAILDLLEDDGNIGDGNDGTIELPSFDGEDFISDQIIIVFEDVVPEVFSEAGASEDLIIETLSTGLEELPGELDDVAQLDDGAVILATVDLPDDFRVGLIQDIHPYPAFGRFLRDQ